MYIQKTTKCKVAPAYQKYKKKMEKQKHKKTLITKKKRAKE